MRECYEGWKKEDGNRYGKCCCTCEHQVRIMKHPWNKIEELKGSMTEVAFYGCNMTEFNKDVVALNSQHGVCEMWMENK